MPGVSEKHVQVTLDNDVLTIQGSVDTSMYAFAPVHRVQRRKLFPAVLIATGC
jgi:HSP20 family molecular chaperone IbpA